MLEHLEVKTFLGLLQLSRQRFELIGIAHASRLPRRRHELVDFLLLRVAREIGVSDLP